MKWLQGNPGLVLARCLLKHRVPAIDSRNERGQYLFHAFGPVRTSTGDVDQWYKKMHEALPFSSPERPTHPLPQGADCCDPYSVSFHYVEAAEQRALSNALAEDFALATNAEKDRWLRDNWPAKPRDLGGYEHPIPPDDPPKRADVRDLITSTLALATPETCAARTSSQAPPGRATVV